MGFYSQAGVDWIAVSIWEEGAAASASRAGKKKGSKAATDLVSQVIILDIYININMQGCRRSRDAACECLRLAWGRLCLGLALLFQCLADHPTSQYSSGGVWAVRLAGC